MRHLQSTGPCFTGMFNLVRSTFERLGRDICTPVLPRFDRDSFPANLLLCPALAHAHSNSNRYGIDALSALCSKLNNSILNVALIGRKVPLDTGMLYL